MAKCYNCDGETSNESGMCSDTCMEQYSSAFVMHDGGTGGTYPVGGSGSGSGGGSGYDTGYLKVVGVLIVVAVILVAWYIW